MNRNVFIMILFVCMIVVTSFNIILATEEKDNKSISILAYIFQYFFFITIMIFILFFLYDIISNFNNKQIRINFRKYNTDVLHKLFYKEK